MANKLELTWYGKDEPIRVEPRLLIENTELSNTAADPETQNMLIHGDNLLALKVEMSRNVQSGNTQNLKSSTAPVRLPAAPASTPGTSQAAVPAGCAYRS